MESTTESQESIQLEYESQSVSYVLILLIMNALPSPATFMRLCPRALRQSRTNIVRSRTARFLITAASQPPLRCPRNFRPIINSITQSRHASSFSVAAKKLFKEQPFSVSLAALMYPLLLLSPVLIHLFPYPLTTPTQNPLRRWHSSLYKLHLPDLHPRRLLRLP